MSTHSKITRRMQPSLRRISRVSSRSMQLSTLTDIRKIWSIIFKEYRDLAGVHFFSKIAKVPLF